MAFPLDHPPLCWCWTSHVFHIFLLYHYFHFFLLLRSVCLLRAATAMERQSAGLQPIIRKEKGMNRKASFHWEMPKYRHIMEAEAQTERRRGISWPAVGEGILWSHSGSPRMMAGTHYTAPTVSSQLKACTDKQSFYMFLWLQMHKHVSNCMMRDWVLQIVAWVCKGFSFCHLQNLILWGSLNVAHILPMKV